MKAINFWPALSNIISPKTRISNLWLEANERFVFYLGRQRQPLWQMNETPRYLAIKVEEFHVLNIPQQPVDTLRLPQIPKLSLLTMSAASIFHSQPRHSMEVKLN